MPDYDLPPIPDVQLQAPALTVPGYQPPSLGIVPPLTLSTDPLLGPGGGSSAAMTAAFGHLTDPPMAPLAPTAPNLFAPIPAAPPFQLNGLPGPISGAINPWLANPMRVAEDAERERLMLPPIDPGLAAQQTIVHAPTIRF